MVSIILFQTKQNIYTYKPLIQCIIFYVFWKDNINLFYVLWVIWGKQWYIKKTRCIKKCYRENDMNNLMILYLFEHLFFISEKHFITMLDFVLRYIYMYNTKQNYQKEDKTNFSLEWISKKKNAMGQPSYLR